MSPKRAAQYVRMSTEHQRYSIEYQTTANQAYAVEHGYELVRTFADPGVSGLTFARRQGLKTLLSTVVGREADFEVVLVYDVSRWGRFQDTDEGAHYEFVCRAAGVPVEYTAEAFANDGSALTSLVKHLKRAMAAEYSRELSERVSRAKRGLGALGFFQGGMAGVGLRRLALRADGAPRAILQAGERNGMTGCRVTLVPGPPEEVALVQRIFRMRAEGRSFREVAEALNALGVPAPSNGAWAGSTIRSIIRNEKYAGTKVTGRTRCRFGRTRCEPEDRWIRKPDAFEALVSQSLFADAQHACHRARRRIGSKPAMLAALAEVLVNRGKLSFNIIRDDPRTPAPTTYVAHFGSLSACYEQVGYSPNRQQRLAAARVRLHKPHLQRGKYARLWREDDCQS